MSMPQAPTTVPLRDLLALGQRSLPWTFVPIAEHALCTGPDDPQLRFLLAANLADLGLRTLAREHLDTLTRQRPQAAERPDVLALISRIEALPDDRIAPADRIDLARASVESLSRRNIDLRRAFEQWAEHLPSEEAYQCNDGNIVRRRDGHLLHLGDQLAAAHQLGEESITKAADSPAPLTIEGLDPPWVLLELVKHTPKLDSGYQPGIRIIQADELELLDGCSQADLADILSHPRVQLFIGPRAAEALKLAIHHDAGTPIGGPYMPLRSLRIPLRPTVAEVIHAGIAEQDHEHAEHLKVIHTRDAQRHTDWWRRRIGEATRPNTSDPLRILIAASRFTTVLHATCRDLARSLRERGCAVELITEPSEHRRLSPLAYSRTLDRFDPDVILAPNHTRADLERIITGTPTPPPEQRVLPVGVPFVLWVQDSMPHLLTTEAGAAIGPLDLAMGYIGRSMIEQFGYPAEAVLPAQLVASEHKFNRSRINPERAKALACDVAIISHHAETPESLRDRLLDELSGSGRAAAIARSILPELDAIAADPMAPPGINTAVRRIVHRAAADLDPSAQEMLIQNVALRLIDRTLRHQSAHWAAEICDANNRTFRIFGKGWDTHPTLGRFAMGPLEHGDDLAAAYNAAGITLHISAFNPLHQRLIECALSGGVPIIRRTHDALRQSLMACKLRILRDLAPQHTTDPNDGCGPVLWFDHLASPETVRYTMLMQRLGMTIKGQIPIRDPKTDPRLGPMHPMQLEADPHRLMGDLWETSYTFKAELECLIQRARTYPNWRSSLSQGIAARANEHFTHNALAEQLLGAIARRAESSTQPVTP